MPLEDAARSFLKPPVEDLLLLFLAAAGAGDLARPALALPAVAADLMSAMADFEESVLAPILTNQSL